MTKTDEELCEEVARELKWDARLNETAISVHVERQIVTLEGTVANWGERLTAQEAAHRVAGVRDVNNRLEARLSEDEACPDAELSQAVRSALDWEVRPSADDPYLVQKAIEAALERRAEREARRINLDVHEGKVILSGVVHSWAERQSVVGAAKATPGVRSVDDRLSIEP
jgi:osmotically-inducible protein OsmY